VWDCVIKPLTSVQLEVAEDCRYDIANRHVATDAGGIYEGAFGKVVQFIGWEKWPLSMAEQVTTR
jgi:hypothetical protein